MNKKLALLGVGVAVGSMMLVTSVYAGVGDAPGYETFKAAVKQTAAVSNVTRNVNVTLEDNGTQVVQVSSVIKSSGKDGAGSADVKVTSGGEVQTIRFYSQDGQRIMQTGGSDVYKVIDVDDAHGKLEGRGMNKHEPSPEALSDGEHVLDALVGNLKNYVTETNAGTGGGKELHFQLTGSQIPAVVNTVGSLLIKHGAMASTEKAVPAEVQSLGFDVAALRDALPKLTSDVKLDEIEMNSSVDSDLHITHQSGSLYVSGKDAQGTAHQLVLHIDMALSSMNSTVPDTVDLTGKTVEHIQFEKPEGRFGRGHEGNHAS
ncbi:hypothetical protein [Paenibacillus whitsoniae]|uniref:Uncharacterized protein n=1 Tax=Paenibacillus whitsoniae TaxID=2496558 RepID=A0A3S0CXP4_9BACL|nr:hypothetical protein [Paenibacillus whitsoniae]RTE11138.1 hypothetical protein EJQ19_03555 [Paenibacillus whitsoniae]